MTLTTVRNLLLLSAFASLVSCLPIPDQAGGASSADETNQQAENCDTATSYEARILCAHNQVRANVSSPAPTPALQPLAWNQDLADVAQDYAEQCVWGHNPDRGDTFNVSIGENLFASTNQRDPEAAVINWADEVEFYSYTDNNCTPGEMCGHYTQIVWRETNEVGCATHYCSQIQNISWPNGGYMVVCNYAPAGNYIGQRPY